MARKAGKGAASDRELLRAESSFLMREDYKTLRTNIAFSFPGKGSKCIAVTSALRSEGKSTNAVNLAISFAQLGKRVLLMDCDLRLPTVAQKLKMKPEAGLTELLIGQCEASDAILYHEETGIHVLPSGAIPPDPTKLLNSKSMGEVLTALKEYFDYIIVDCPPTNMVVDAVLLAPYVDGYLLIVKHEQTQYRDIQEMLEQLKRVDANILGFAYVNAPLTERKYYRNYRKYGGSYYYQYGKRK